jgi:hypothetical protein
MSDDILCGLRRPLVLAILSTQSLLQLHPNTHPTPILNPISKSGRTSIPSQLHSNFCPELHPKTHLIILTHKADPKGIPKLHPILLFVFSGILNITILDQELTADSRDGINITQSNVSRK